MQMRIQIDEELEVFDPQPTPPPPPGTRPKNKRAILIRVPEMAGKW